MLVSLPGPPVVRPWCLSSCPHRLAHPQDSLYPIPISSTRSPVLGQDSGRFRFYTITWQMTLWEEWTIRTAWGRIGGVGRSQVTYFDSEQASRGALPGLFARRIERGYVARGVPGAAIRQMPSPVDIRAQRLLTLRSNVHTDRWTAKEGTDRGQLRWARSEPCGRCRDRTSTGKSITASQDT